MRHEERAQRTPRQRSIRGVIEQFCSAALHTLPADASAAAIFVLVTAVHLHFIIENE